MPPHCDTRDGPVARAVEKALDSRNVNHILIWIPKESESEMKAVFRKAMKAWDLGDEAKEVVSDWILENAVRLHRAGEGVSYTGIKPSGLDEGPVVPKAEKAIETGDPSKVIKFINDNVRKELLRRFKEVRSRKDFDPDNVKAGREYVHAFIGFVSYSHNIYKNLEEED